MPGLYGTTTLMIPSLRTTAKRPSTRLLSGYGLIYRERRLCRRTFPPALGVSRTLGVDLPLCRLILCGRILRGRNLLMIFLNFAPDRC
jgi:hypothetical protein